MRANGKTIKGLLICICAALLCITLAGCGGSASSGSASASAASGSASASASASATTPADPAEKFVGDWQIAALQMNDAVVVGDFSAFGEDAINNMRLTVNADGTGSMVYGGGTAEFAWELADDNTIKIKPQTETEGLAAGVNEDGTINVVFADNCLSISMSDDTYTGAVFFSKDGTYKDVKAVTAADCKPITSESDLIGQWKLAGAGMGGMTVFGDEASIQSLGMPSISLSFEEGGKAMLDDQEASWSVSADGAKIEASSMGAQISMPVLTGGDYLVLDLSEMFGTDMCFLFTK